MWVVKFQFDGGGILYGKTAKNFNGTIRGYNLSSYEKNKLLIVTSVGKFFGDDKNKQKAMNFLKKDKHIVKLEEKNGFFIITVKEDLSFKPFYSPLFIYVSPVVIDNQGIYSFHIGSWKREDIEKLLKTVENYPLYKLISLKQEKIENISLIGLHPNLTEKQRKAHELAVENGYYEYPKKINLKKLAQFMKISYSTYQQHLKYAEKKINNFFLGK